MQEIKVLDHGYVKLIDMWGSDQAIIESARMSTGKGFLGWEPGPCPVCDGSGHPCEPPGFINTAAKCTACEGKGQVRGDKHLLRFMWEHAHSTPFEFGGMVVEVKAPLAVFREWHRHRSQGYSEASARYSPLPDENYLPTVERCMMGGGANKQAGAVKGADVLTETDALAWLAELADVYDHCERVYQSGLKRGIPKELARLCVPVGRYSKMRATTNLRMWLAFSTLRSTAKNPAAQWEIRQFADVVGDLLAEKFPRTWAIFNGAT